MRRRFRSVRMAAALLPAAMAAQALPGMALAAPPPISSKPVNITARNTDLPDFLERLFAQGGFRVQVSNSLRGRQINGRFQGTVSEVWNQVGTAFNLVAYYDGAVVRIYAARDLATRRFDDVNARAIAVEARRMRLTDENNTVSASGTSVSATGVPAFLQQIATIAGRNRATAIDDGAAGGGSPAIASVVPHGDPAPSRAEVRDAARDLVQSEILRLATVRDPYEVRIFFLRYASANDTFTRFDDGQTRIAGIASILTGIMGDGRLPGTVRTSGDDTDRYVGGLRPTLDFGDGDGIALVPERAAASERPRRDEPVVGGVNGPRIEVDDTQNAVIVRDRPEAMSVYEGIIAALDQAPRMVEIEAAIIDLNTDKLRDLGIDFNLSVDGLDLLFGGSSFDPAPGFSAPNIGGSYVTGSGDSFAARLTALERQGVINVVSRPQLITLDNRAALFGNRQEIYVQIQGTIGRLERVAIGTQLRVTPAIIYDDGDPRVRLLIDIEDGSPTSSIVDGLPVLRRSRVSSQAVIHQGESLLLGGITIDSEFEYRTKVPVLGDIPLFGQLFRRRREGSQRVERLFLLTPRIVGHGAAGTPLSRREPIPLDTLRNLRAEGGGERRGER